MKEMLERLWTMPAERLADLIIEIAWMVFGVLAALAIGSLCLLIVGWIFESRRVKKRRAERRSLTNNARFPKL